MVQSFFDIKGKRALVTGSTRGIGRSLAEGLAQAGALVFINGRSQDSVDRVCRDFCREGYHASGKAFDICDSKSVTQAIHGIKEEYGSIDILVNNAGIMKREPLLSMPEAMWQSVIQTNLTSAFLVGKEVASLMAQNEGGKIINICSLMSEVGRVSTGAYAAAKGGLKMLTKAMATEWASYDIQVNGIGPGYILTEMTQPLSEDMNFDAWLKKRTPARRWGKPSDLIGSLLFLASPASNFVNGQIIYVDGGILASL
ncbi:MAG: SDR family oxidoreductase [Aminobacterium sp.]|uniref:SDR family oxidoreductase n=1 Tax=Aminobacterium sp. TaxID=1872491 RepID=UPI002B203943|nr:SDR family oxidoreductase [Aminobacterium sp.]MEA4877488.1 SDR family oxidoreductase [Aminobacterium sp.]